MDVMTIIWRPKNGAVSSDLHGRNVAWFYESHKLDHIKATVGGNVRDFCEIKITYCNEQKFDLTYLR